MIARALEAMVGKKIPSSALSRFTKEIEEEIRDRVSEPQTMLHYKGEKISSELQQAYSKAGYQDTSNVTGGKNSARA